MELPGPLKGMMGGPRGAPPANAPATTPPRVLCVGTIEGRKNHLALLEAAEVLWSEGINFELQLIGLARPDTAGPALAKVADLQRAGRPNAPKTFGSRAR